MKTQIMPDTDIGQNDTQGWDAVHRRLTDILTYLKALEEKKDAEITALRKELQECRQAGEGTRQLINKLLNDIDNYRKDIVWYQRTYETRSLPGAIWQKLLRKRRNRT
jgi:uncharacterized coiled-coil DUF342 family protein